MEIDKKDLQILSILDWNARMPMSKIAKQIKLNKDVVRYRINNLEKNKIIESYYTIINTPKLGYITYRLYFDFFNINTETENKIVAYLDKKFNAGQIFSIDGEYQLGIIFLEKSVYNLYKKLKEFKTQFGNYLNKNELTIFTILNQYPIKIFNENSREIISLREEKIIKIKEDDLKLLEELSKNARTSSIDLSLKLKIPQTTVIHKIKQLEKNGIILGYRAKIDINKLGYQNYYLEIYTKNSKEIKEIIDYSKYNKNCIYSCEILSGADMELETEFKDKLELLKFIDNLKNKFKSIKKIKYWSTLKYHKLSYFPF